MDRLLLRYSGRINGDPGAVIDLIASRWGLREPGCERPGYDAALNEAKFKSVCSFLAQMNFLRLTIKPLWRDTLDEMLEIRVQLEGRGYAAWQDAYTYPAYLEEFAKRLQAFPSTQADEVVLQTNSINVEQNYSLKFRAYVTDGSGHCAVEFAARADGHALHAIRFEFSVATEAAALNEMGRQLAVWAVSPIEPFCFESRND